jgi:hypothetical protein
MNINPSSLGERLRRFASTYETYSFQSIVFHYAPARGTNTTGSALGFFDQDPVDVFDSGTRSLAEAAAHSGAHSVKIWQDGYWAAPPRLKGRFYVGDSGNTAADKRLQQQGTFRMLLDIPVEESLFSETGIAVLGSLYVEYVCDMHKPTIQSNFVGTSDYYSTGSYTTKTGAIVGSTVSIIRDGWVLNEVLTSDPRNNVGTYINPSNGYMVIPTGLWHISVQFEWNWVADATGNANVHLVAGPDHASPTSNGWSDGETGSQATPVPVPTRTRIQVLAIQADPTFVNSQIFNLGAMLLVPSGTRGTNLDLQITTQASTAAVYTYRLRSIRVSSAWPSVSQQALIDSSAGGLMSRVNAIERKLRVDTTSTFVPPPPPLLIKRWPETPRPTESKTEKLDSSDEQMGFEHVPPPVYMPAPSNVPGTAGYRKFVVAPHTR